MNGLPMTVTVAALAVGIGSVLLLIVGYLAEQRAPRRAPWTLDDLVPLCLCDACLSGGDAALLAHVRGDR